SFYDTLPECLPVAYLKDTTVEGQYRSDVGIAQSAAHKGCNMTIGPTPRARRVWDWLTGTHSKKSAYWLILGPTIALTCIGAVMVLSASAVESIGGGGSCAYLSSQGICALI